MDKRATIPRLTEWVINSVSAGRSTLYAYDSWFEWRVCLGELRCVWKMGISVLLAKARIHFSKAVPSLSAMHFVSLMRKIIMADKR